MKQFLSCLLALCMLACSAPSTEPSAAVPEEPKAPHDYGITASYSTDFSLGDVANGDAVIKLWKYFDENNFADASLFADSVVMMFPMYTAKMSRDSVIAMASAERGTMDSCVTTVDAIVPLKASNKDEHVVCIWGRENAVIKGQKRTRDLHEVWGFNKEGKVAWMKQYVHDLK
jgi:hypothetical protein